MAMRNESKPLYIDNSPVSSRIKHHYRMKLCDAHQLYRMYINEIFNYELIIIILMKLYCYLLILL